MTATNADAPLIRVFPIKVTKLRVNVTGGYQLLSGWTLTREDGAYMSTNGTTPYFPRGGKSAVESIVEVGGVLPSTKFIVCG